MKLRTLIGYAVIAIAIIVAYEAIVTDVHKHVPVPPLPKGEYNASVPLARMPSCTNTNGDTCVIGACMSGSLLMVRPPKGSKAAPHWACNDFRRADLPQR